jgi:hypothetical protein
VVAVRFADAVAVLAGSVEVLEAIVMDGGDSDDDGGAVDTLEVVLSKVVAGMDVVEGGGSGGTVEVGRVKFC